MSADFSFTVHFFISRFDYKRFATDAEILKIHKSNKEDQKSSFTTFTPQNSSVADKAMKDDSDNDDNNSENIADEAVYETPGEEPKKKKRKKKKTQEQLKELELEELARIRNKYHIHTTGSDIPPPLASFQQLQEEYDVNTKIIENIEAQGYTEPTGIQRQAWPLMIQGMAHFMSMLNLNFN